MGSALWDQHCGISTELKFHEFATKPDGVALLPISHDCEDDECVDESVIYTCNSICCRT